MKNKDLQQKTNVMRILDQANIPYKSHCYLESGLISGKDICDFLQENPQQVFKTLVTVANNNNHYVFVVPVSHELDYKKAAKSVNEKNITMLKQKDLFNLTGYVHGGCSPVGMKKYFKTVIDKSAQNFSTIMISGGKIGYQVEISCHDLAKIINFDFDDITR